MSLADFAVPLIQKMSPEAAHAATLAGLRLGVGLPSIPASRWNTAITLPQSGLTFGNPVGLAAGFDKNADVFRQMARFGFGYIECGTVTPQPQPGNPKPRLFRLREDAAVINRMGFNNHGLDYFVRRLRKHRRGHDTPLGANVGANKTSPDFIADYETGIAAVRSHADYITINISSPNTPGLRALQGRSALQDLLSRCHVVAGSDEEAAPVFLKIAPDLTDSEINDIIETIRDQGKWLAGLIISNTTSERPASLSSRYRDEPGGLSGAPLMARSTAVLKVFASELGGQFDLIGCGGIASGADAYAKIRAGAQAVQLYSALAYKGPGLIAKINKDLAERLSADGFRQVSQAVGADLH